MARQGSSRRSEQRCACSSTLWGYTLLMLAGPLLLVHFMKPREWEEWARFAAFVGGEVPKELFVKFAWTPLLFHMLYPFSPAFMYIAAVACSALHVQFLSFYFAPKALVDAIPSGGFLQACEPGNSFKSSCSILQDLTTIYTDKTKGAAVWVDDYSFLAVVTLVFVVIESYRYKRAIIPWVLATLLLGPDCVLPIFLTGHMHRESAAAPAYSKARVSTPYYALAFLGLVSWYPNLFSWVGTVGTVAGQLEAGVALPVGARATWAIMITAFTVGFYGTRPIHYGDSTLAVIFSWLVKLGYACLLCSNVAVALAVLLFFREKLPQPSFFVEAPQRSKGRDE